MIGQQICKIIPNCVEVSHKTTDLRNINECYELFKNHQYETVYHLAGHNGGIEYNRLYPADIYYNTTQINLNILKCCQLFEVKKVINVIASCSYPDLGNKFLEEGMFNQGACNPTVEAHGYAKRILLHYSRQLYKQYGLKSVNCVLTNCYGPGDRFDLMRTKVVGATIKKLCDAKLNNLQSVTFFGSGMPFREIMFCKDAAACLVKIGDVYDNYMEPVNIGSDQEISIRDLVMTVANLCEYTGEIVWDTSKPDGQMRKKLDTNKMKRYISHKMTPLEDGLKETIEYYLKVGKYLDR